MPCWSCGAFDRQTACGPQGQDMKVSGKNEVLLVSPCSKQRHTYTLARACLCERMYVIDVNVCICVCIYIIYIYIYNIYIYICIYVCVCVCIYVYIHMCVCVCVRLHVYIHLRASTCIHHVHGSEVRAAAVRPFEALALSTPPAQLLGLPAELMPVLLSPNP